MWNRERLDAYSTQNATYPVSDMWEIGVLTTTELGPFSLKENIETNN